MSKFAVNSPLKGKKKRRLFSTLVVLMASLFSGMKPLLVLDLHGTLVDNKGTKFRPGCQYLFDICLESKINVAIWSAGDENSVAHVAAKLEREFGCHFEFVWNLSHCQMRTDFFKASKIPFITKPLSKFKLEEWNPVWILDDTKETAFYNFKQLISIKTWNGSTSDKGLYEVADFLKRLMSI